MFSSGLYTGVWEGWENPRYNMATSPLLLEGKRRIYFPVDSGKWRTLVRKCQTSSSFWRGSEMFTIHWERTQGGWRSGPCDKSLTGLSPPTVQPAAPSLPLLTCSQGWAEDREMRLQRVCCLELRRSQKCMGLLPFSDTPQPRKFSEITTKTLWGKMHHAQIFIPCLAHPLLM